MIADRVGRTRPDLALDLMWRFMELAGPVLNRVDDSSGGGGDVFRAACEGLGALAARAKPEPQGLAERVFAAITRDEEGEAGRLGAAGVPAPGRAGAAGTAGARRAGVRRDRQERVWRVRPPGRGRLTGPGRERCRGAQGQ